MGIAIQLHSGNRRLAVSVEIVALAVLGLFLVAIALDALGLAVPLARPFFAVLLLTFVPGALVLTLFGFGPRRELRWLVYVVGLSLVVVMAEGLVINYRYPAVGIERPLSPASLAVTYTFLVVVLAAAIRLLDPPGRALAVPERIELSPTPLSLLLLPTTAVLAVAVLNRTGTNVPILLLLGALALVPLAVASGRLDARWQPLALWAVGISLLYHNSLSRFHEFSGQGNVIDAWKFGRWTLQPTAAGWTTTSLLPNVTISSTYAHLAGIDIFTQLNAVNPLWVSFVPLIAFVTFRRFVRPRDAFLAVCVFAFAHPFYTQLPNGERAATPVFFLALLVAVLTDTKLSALSKRSLGLAFTAGLVVSHYGAAYLVMLAVLVTVPTVILLERIEGSLFAQARGLASDGGRSLARSGGRSAERNRLFSPTYAVLYAVMAIGWYMYTDSGQKFALLPEHAVKALNDLFGAGTGGAGGTANRLTREYGAVSIQVSKGIYVLLTVLTVVGLLAVYRQRLFDTDGRRFDVSVDEFLVLSTALLGAFGLSLFTAGSWGGGRPMALVFSVTSVFVVIGATTLGELATSVADRFDRPLAGLSMDRSGRLGRTTLAVVLALLLVVNTGVAAAAVGGSAPSTVPLQPRIATSDDPELRTQAYVESDVDMYVWLVDHRDMSLNVFGDWVTINQYNDWYRPRISAAVDPRRPYGTLKRKNTIADALGSDERPKYVMFGGHNTVLGVAAERNGTATPLTNGGRALAAYDKVYTTGYSRVYLSEDETDHPTTGARNASEASALSG